jgi:formylglycine-generating enzyme required for sulfatase activity
MRAYIIILGVLLLGAVAANAQPAPKSGTTFRDCPNCPEMVTIAPGSFTMGEVHASGRTDLERASPQHAVNIGYKFAVGRYDVTFDEWDACAADGGCSNRRPDDHGWGRGRRPVINVTWDDAREYAAWLSKKTGKHYRLLSESEFEYVARAGTTTEFWWGDELGKGNADCSDCGSQWDSKQTAPVGSFQPNPFGVYDTAGEVTEWIEDRWNGSYQGAPLDGSAWETGDPLRRVMRHGSWFNRGDLQHSAYRNGDAPNVKNQKIGFRVAVTL